MDPTRYLALFLSESREQLTRAYGWVARLEQEPRDAESLRALRRNVHSLKGMGATMSCGAMVRLAHELEDVFACGDRRRRGVGDLGRIHEALTDLGRIIDELEREHPAEARRGTDGPARRYRVDLRLVAPAAAQATLTVSTLRRLGTIGFVEAVRPPLLRGRPARFDGRLILTMRFPGTAGELGERVRAIEEVDSVDVLEAGAATTSRPRGSAGATWTQVRSDRLDLAAEQAFELLSEHKRVRSSDPVVSEALGRLEAQARKLLDAVTQMRLVPVSSIVQRSYQTVGELSRRLGKPLRLRVEGGDVQLDRSRLDALQEPLQHLLRNAVDHGIESPADRRAAGKPTRATLTLRLARRGARTSISLEDDGRGLDPDLLRRTAVARGLLTADEATRLNDDQSRMLITLPSFTTATTVSRDSGRGVGMDVVRDIVEGMGGHLLVHSRTGQMTRIEIVLPGSRALIHALVVRCRQELYALPLAHVGAVRPAATGADAGLPVIGIDPRRGPHRLAGAGGLEAPHMLLELDGRGVALAVDEIVGRREIVIRPLERPLDRLLQYAGGGVLEDGRVVLVLDPDGLPPIEGQSM